MFDQSLDVEQYYSKILIVTCVRGTLDIVLFHISLGNTRKEFIGNFVDDTNEKIKAWR